jgi:capsular polysaccharide biosynthesis protein
VAIRESRKNPQSREISLYSIDEMSDLRTVNSVSTLLSKDTKNGRIKILGGSQQQPFLGHTTNKLLTGGYLPEWCTPDQKVNCGEINLFKVSDVYYFPRLGTLVSASGGVYSKTYAEARYLYGEDFRIPGSSRSEGKLRYVNIPQQIHQLEDDALVFLPWGAIHNYGHFVIDALPSLAVLNLVDTTKCWNAVCAPLTTWQSDLISAFENERIKIHQLNDEIYHLKTAYYFDVMDHFLHRSNDILADVRTAATRRFPTTTQFGQSNSRLAIIRRNNKKRICENEAALLDGLKDRGFTVVAPEDFSIEEQIKIFSSAQVVVGVSGAALANVIFCKPGAHLIEIQPDLAQNVWIRNLCLNVGARWNPFFAIAKGPKRLAVVGGVSRPELNMVFNVELDKFSALVDEILFEADNTSAQNALADNDGG